MIVVTPKPYVPVTPAPTPKPTPKPTPTPKPVVSLGSGTISSDTGTWINVDAKWSAESVNNNSARIKVVVNLRSYGLHSVAGSKTLSISVGGQSVALNVKALEIDSDTEVTTELGSASFTVSAPAGQTTTIPVEAGWHFGGVYSGVELDVISAAGEIAIKR